MKISKKINILLISFLLFFNLGFEREDDSYEREPQEKSSPVNQIYDFNLLDYNAFNVGLSSFKDESVLAMGVTWDKNINQKFLFHSRFLFAFPTILGVKMDLGLGYIIKGKKGIRDYNQVFWSGSGYSRTYYHRSGKTRVNSISSFDFGIRQYLLFFNDDYGYSTSASWAIKDKSFDSIFYFGYRYDYIMDKFMPLQQFSFSIHGMVGLVNRREFKTEDGSVTIDTKREDVAFGFKARIKWLWLEFEGGYFDDQFYMETALNLTLSFF